MIMSLKTPGKDRFNSQSKAILSFGVITQLTHLSPNLFHVFVMVAKIRD